MSKTLETKKKIIKLLGERHMTLSELSEKLELSPSTIEQHLKELEGQNAIKSIDDPYIKKWKYYTISDDAADGKTGMTTKQKVFTTLLLSIAAVLVLSLLLYVPSTPAYIPTGEFLVQLTDPPIVPSGTQALIVNYDRVALHEYGASNATGFVNFNLSGTVNLLNLTNVTQTIGMIKTTTNQTFDAVRLYISSAEIEIDNVTYNVTLPAGYVSARISSQLNSTSGGLLIDVNTVVAQIYTNSSTSVFVMVPSLSAVVIGRSEISAPQLTAGYRSSLRPSIASRLRAAESALSIVNASASTGGDGVTHISITIKNSGNSTVTLKHVILSGMMLGAPKYETFNGIVAVAAQPYGGDTSSASSADARIQESLNATNESMFNSSIAADLHISTATTVKPEDAIEVSDAALFKASAHNTLNFLVTGNGSLALPFDEMQAFEGEGYGLAPNSTVTLSFNSVISLGWFFQPKAGQAGRSDGASVGAGASAGAIPTVLPPVIAPRGNLLVELIPNQTYGMEISGTEGASVSGNIVATGSINFSASNTVDVTSVQLQRHDYTTNVTTSMQLYGFTAQGGSYVYYAVPNECGFFGGISNSGEDAATTNVKAIVSEPCIPAISNVSFVSNTAGFTVLNVTDYPILPPSTPDCLSCAGVQTGTSYRYVLQIGVPASNYTGVLSISEFYSSSTPTASANVSTNSSSDESANAPALGAIKGTVDLGKICSNVFAMSNSDCVSAENESSLYASLKVTLRAAGGAGSYNVGVNATGGFYTAAAPGTYIISIANCASSTCRYEVPKYVTVTAGQTTDVEIS